MCNQYKVTLDDFMNSSAADSLESPRSEGVLIGSKPDLERNDLDIDERD